MRGWYPYGRLEYIYKFMEERDYYWGFQISEVLKVNRVYQTQRDVFVVNSMVSSFFPRMQ